MSLSIDTKVSTVYGTGKIIKVDDDDIVLVLHDHPKGHFHTGFQAAEDYPEEVGKYSIKERKNRLYWYAEEDVVVIK